MRIIFYLLLFIFLFPLLCFSQTTFFKTYGDTVESHDDVGHAVMQTEDGGYIVAGETGRYLIYGHPTQYYGDVFLVKTDQYGDTIWTKTYGDTGAVHESAYSMDKTNDGGYIISTYYTDGKFLYGLCLIKTNSQGDSIWTKKYSVGKGYCIKKTNDDGYIITGYGANGKADIYLLKIDIQGDSVWLKTYDQNSYPNIGRYVQQTSDGGYIIAGYTEFPEPRYLDIWLIKTNAQGDTLWTKTYGGDYDDFANSICETEDGGYFIAGIYTGGGGGSELEYHIWLLKTDSIGDTIWTKKIDTGGYYDYANSCKQTSDGGFIIAGETDNIHSHDIYLIKLDQYGNIQWTSTIGGTEDERGYDIAETVDMGYIITGFQAKDNYRDIDLCLLKVDHEGKLTGINEFVSVTPKQFKLFQNYPNPFNPETQINFQLSVSGIVKIAVFNLLGQKIATLFNGKNHLEIIRLVLTQVV